MKISAWFHLLAAALLVTPAGASPVRPQTLASADAVPEGLTAPEWSSIRQQYEQQRHGDATLQEWFMNDHRGLEHGFTVNQQPPVPEPRRSRREEARYFPPRDQSLLTSAPTDEILTLPLPGFSPKMENSFGSQPLAFERNVGQVDSAVQFFARGPGYQLFLTESEAVMVLPELRDRNADAPAGEFGGLENWWGDAEAKQSRLAEGHAVPAPGVLRMRLVGADPSPAVRGDVELRSKANYFLGNEPSHWLTNVSTFAKVRYRAVYPGTDLVYYGREGRLEYDFVLAPGADPGRVALNFEGADRVELDEQGDLVAWVSGRPVRWQKPVVYQEFAGERHAIAATYRLQRGSVTFQPAAAHQIGFELAAYDRSRPLVIDPVLIYSTYLGGSGSDAGSAIATDSHGNAYVVGYTMSLDFPRTNALQPALLWSKNAFVTKLNPAGELLFSTYLSGGSYGGDGPRVALDAQGNVYVVGSLTTTNWPLVNPVQTFYGRMFLTTLSPDGSAIRFSTYLGGTNSVTPYGLALDPAGNIYVGGGTGEGFPTHNALQPQYGGANSDGFVIKLEAGGNSIIYSTYYGGSGFERVNGIAADAEGNAYIVGGTSFGNGDLWVRNAYQPYDGGGSPQVDMFYAKIVPDGSDLVYASYFGGSEGDNGVCIALGPSGTLWIAGQSCSPGLATPGAFQTSFSPGGACGNVLARFNAADGYLEAATYLEGGDLLGIAVDPAGGVFIGGIFYGNLPLVNPLQSQPGGGYYYYDGYVAKFSSDCSSLLFSTYFCGPGRDYVNGLALDPNGNLLLVGETQSETGFPIVNAFQPTLNGGDDAFVAKISFAEVLKVKRVGQTLAISWPATATGYQLESTAGTGAGAVWENVTTPPVVVATEQIVTVDIGAGTRFFRLRKL